MAGRPVRSGFESVLALSLLLGLACALQASAGEGAASLPDPLLRSNGEPVADAAQWTALRRPEILELFQSQVYGRNAVERPSSLRFEAVGGSAEAMGGAAVRRQFDVVYSGPGGEGRFRLLLFLPAKAAKPVPAFLLICNRGPANIDPDRKTPSPFWPAEEIVARGYAAAAFCNGEAAKDRPDLFSEGAPALFKKNPDEAAAPDAWGALGVWAWAASRALDCLETVPEIDKSKVAVVGHSRGGKTALWCGAQDERFAMAVSNCSGCGGAALSRGKEGESVAQINKTFPHWFCANFKKYDGAEEKLPVDQHMLLALLAPRLLYVASAAEDSWADPASEFRSCVLASRVYSLLGVQGLQEETMPPLEKPLLAGRIGYHIRPGKHDLTPYDWARFMDFADLHLKAPQPKP